MVEHNEGVGWREEHVETHEIEKKIKISLLLISIY